MTDEIRVTQDKMFELISALQSSVRDLEHILDNLNSELIELSGPWSGDASNAYQHAQRRWLASTTSMKELLERYRSETVTTQERFEVAAKQATRLWS